MEKKKTILVVDDEKNVRESLNEIFKDEYNIVMAASGEEAIEKIEKHNINIVLLDIMLPFMDGFAVLGSIRKNYDGLPVVIVSALKDEKSIQKAMNLGATGYVAKPFDVVKIRNVVDEILNVYSQGGA
jgi:DNA-binding NtrC family response regulator